MQKSVLLLLFVFTHCLSAKTIWKPQTNFFLSQKEGKWQLFWEQQTLELSSVEQTRFSTGWLFSDLQRTAIVFERDGKAKYLELVLVEKQKKKMILLPVPELWKTLPMGSIKAEGNILNLFRTLDSYFFLSPHLFLQAKLDLSQEAITLSSPLHQIPKNLYQWMNLAGWHFQTENHKEAVRAYILGFKALTKEAVVVEPSLISEIQIDFAISLMKIGYPERAVPILQQVRKSGFNKHRLKSETILKEIGVNP